MVQAQLATLPHSAASKQWAWTMPGCFHFAKIREVGRVWLSLRTALFHVGTHAHALLMAALLSGMVCKS